MSTTQTPVESLNDAEIDYLAAFDGEPGEVQDKMLVLRTKYSRSIIRAATVALTERGYLARVHNGNIRTAAGAAVIK